jgi:magnesium-transporting ATPase (P-type)
MRDIQKVAIFVTEMFFMLLNAIPLILGVFGIISGVGFVGFVLVFALNPIGIAFMSDSGPEGMSTILHEILFTIVLPSVLIGIINACLVYTAYKSIMTFLHKTYVWYWIVFVCVLLSISFYSTQFLPLELFSNEEPTAPESIGTYVGVFIAFLIISTPQILYIRSRHRRMGTAQSTHLPRVLS